MGGRMLLGAAVGGSVSLLSWSGNRTAHHVSVFPDGASVLALAGLTGWAVWFCARRLRVRDVVGIWKVGGTIAATAGFVFGTVMVLIGITRFGQLNLLLLVFGFLTAFGSARFCGAAASGLVSRVLARRDGAKAT